MTNYQKRKQAARQKAIDWQIKFEEIPMSWQSIVLAHEHFKKLGKRYGLLREFRENGII